MATRAARAKRYSCFGGHSALGERSNVTLIMQPERVTDASVARLRYTLSNDVRSRSWLVGPNCRLCGHAAEFEYGQHGLR